MNSFRISRRVLTLCREGVSIGAAYTRVAADMGIQRSDVVNAYLRAANARFARRTA